MPAKSNLEAFLTANRERFGTRDGLPSAFQREVLFDRIRPGKRVGILVPSGVGPLNLQAWSKVEGRAVMRGPAGWILNLGGRHGTPGLASADNTIFVAGVHLAT